MTKHACVVMMYFVFAWNMGAQGGTLRVSLPAGEWVIQRTHFRGREAGRFYLQEEDGFFRQVAINNIITGTGDDEDDLCVMLHEALAFGPFGTSLDLESLNSLITRTEPEPQIGKKFLVLEYSDHDQSRLWETLRMYCILGEHGWHVVQAISTKADDSEFFDGLTFELELESEIRRGRTEFLANEDEPGSTDEGQGTED